MAKEEMLDLSKALKRTNWQPCGVAWKSDTCVVSVKKRKPFKKAELKELKTLLPEGMDKGAKILAGRFKANAKTDVEFEFPAKGPKEMLLRRAMKSQTEKTVTVTKKLSETKKSDEP